MTTITLSKFAENIETQFEDLGLTLTKSDGDLAWLYYDANAQHRATLRAVVSPSDSFIRIKFVVESFYTEPDEDGNFDGTIWSGFESVETAIIRLIKVISDVRRESLSA
jgi:hypothetical protein